MRFMRDFVNREDLKYMWDLYTGDAVQKTGALLDWPASIVKSQKDWIGKSEGVNFKEKVKDMDINFEVYDSIPQTFLAQTFVVIAPDHPMLKKLVENTEYEKPVLVFAEAIARKKNQNRFDIDTDLEGIFTGRYVENPFGTGDLPIWVASYVLSDYGTGIVNCSAHDARDFAFAKKYNIPLKIAMLPADKDEAKKVADLEYSYLADDGVLIAPAVVAGKKWKDVRKEVIEYIEKMNYGRQTTNYKLRDWVFSRQRYWGEPIPVVHCERHGVVPVPEKDLPVALPKVKSYEPTGTGESPLAAIEKWVNTKCPTCEAESKAPKYFIFDFDGVLGDTWDAALDARVSMGDSKDREDAKNKFLSYMNNKTPYGTDTVLSKERLKEDVEWVKTLGNHIINNKPGLFTEFIKEIKKYRNAHYAVVSSGAKSYVEPTLKKSGMKFSHILTFEDHHSKEEKVKKICKDWGISEKDAYFFTDTKSDICELENYMDRTKLIGCVWGYSGIDVLKGVLPEKQILKDFKDIHRFFNFECKARRETNTMPQWAGSSWYYLRYEDPKNKKALVDIKKEKYWSPVDLYVGGAEHATRHLIYARFWHKFLYDIGVVSTIEPFIRLQHVGLIMGEDGRKMSKRFGNVVNPDDMVRIYGADTMRIYEMFMGPFDQQIAWSTNSMIGARRFVEKVWKLTEKVSSDAHETSNKIIHKTIRKVSADIELLAFNTAISSLMIAVNELEKTGLNREQFEIMLKLLAPFAPHMTEELWSTIGNKKSIHLAPWPKFDPRLATDTSMVIVVQVNGKMRGSFESPIDSTEETLKSLALALPEIKKWTDGKEIKKIIFIKGKLISIVI